MITEEQYRALREEVEEAKQQAERAAGALEQLTEQLKQEYGCENIKQAKKKLAELEEQAQEAEDAFNKAYSDYKRKWTS